MARPTARDFVLYNYTDAVSGQIQVGTLNGPWTNVENISKLLVQGVITNSTGTTQVFVDQSNDGVASDIASADQFASLATGAEVNVAFRYARVRIVQATAATTAADLAVKGSD